MNKLFRINDWSFGAKIGAALILIGILPVSITSVILSTNAAQELKGEAFNELETLVTARQIAITDWFEERHGDVDALSADPTVIQAMEQLHAGIASLGEGSHEVGQERARALYLGNPDLYDAGDGSAYSSAHAEYHPFFMNYRETFGYYDLILVNVDGDIVYSTDKEDEFGTNLTEGPYATSNLGAAFQETSLVADPNFSMLEDFEFFSPANEPSAFFASPIFDGQTRVGALIFQLPLDKLNEILNDNTGLGESGETYVVGPNLLFRNDSRFLDQLGTDSTVLNQDFVVDTVAANSAFAGNSGIQIIDNYRGSRVLSAWHPMVMQEPEPGVDPVGVTWALIAEIDEAEVLAPVRRQRATAIISTIVAALAAASLAFILTRLLTRQVDEISKVFRAAAIGEFGARAEVLSRDELGRTAEGLNAMLGQLSNLLAIARSEASQIFELSVDMLSTLGQDGYYKTVNPAFERTLGWTPQEMLAKPFIEFVHPDDAARTSDAFASLGTGQTLKGYESRTLCKDGSYRWISWTATPDEQGLIYSVARDITNRKQVADDVTHVVQLMVDQATVSADMAERATTGAREGDLAVRETVSAMTRIRDSAQETALRMKRLGEATQEISEVVRVIEELSDRTNVLALNASIQAAAAGDAGRGFAVVAEEVQRLAERATSETRRIEELVGSIQTETNEATIGIDEATQEVVEGSRLAEQAGERMLELNQLVDELANLIQYVVENTAQQTRESLALLGTVAATESPRQHESISQHHTEGNGAKAGAVIAS